MQSFNIFDGELDEERTQPAGFTWRAARLGPKLGAERIGASLFELQPGERTFSYRYEYGAEEWLLVVAGRPTPRAPDGEHELRPGDVVCFPEGPEGAHLVRNDTDEPTRWHLDRERGRSAADLQDRGGRRLLGRRGLGLTETRSRRSARCRRRACAPRACPRR